METDVNIIKNGERENNNETIMKQGLHSLSKMGTRVMWYLRDKKEPSQARGDSKTEGRV